MSTKYQKLLKDLLSHLRDFRSTEQDLDATTSQRLKRIESFISSQVSESSDHPDTTPLVPRSPPCNSLVGQPSANIDISSHKSDSPVSDALGWLNKELEIAYDTDEGVIKLRPDSAQWVDFPNILQAAENLGADKLGAFKVVVPDSGRLTEQDNPEKSGRAFRTHPLPNGTVQIETIDGSNFSCESSEEVTEDLPSHMAIEKFERLISTESGLQHARYRTDISLRFEEDRERTGLPSSPIYPLAGNDLAKTKASVPGLHWPYAYEANAAFGSPFSMHREDWDLCSVNHLYRGSKVWILVSPASMNLLEEQIRQLNNVPPLDKCSQFLRHQSLYIPTNVLEKMGVSYTVIRQHAGESVVTFPRAYHQGFSVGGTLAEAINYAHDKWDVSTYTECSRRRCPKDFITREMMELRSQDEQQWSAAVEDEQNSERMDVDPQTMPEHEPGNRKSKTGASTNDNDRYNESREVSINVIRPKSGRSKSIQSSKRKHEGSKNVEADKKYLRASRQTVSNHFNQIVTKPAVNPWNIYGEFVELASDIERGFDESNALLLTRIFYAIGSPDAFCQLQDACIAIRTGTFDLSRPSENIKDTIQALDRVETTIQLTSIARRYYLMSLCNLRDKLTSTYSQQPRRSNRSFITDLSSDGKPGRAATQTLDTMMEQAYPSLKKSTRAKVKDEYNKKRDMLRTRLSAGDRWSKLANTFALGIVALVPTQGDHQLSNNDYERLSGSALQALISMLQKHRAEFLQQVSSSISALITSLPQLNIPEQRFLFEHTEKSHLKNERQDSSRLIELCKFDDDQANGVTG